MSEQQSLTPPAKLRERAAEEIRVILARKRMSAAELARRTDIKQPYLSRRMTGEIAFDLDDLEVIARELNVTVVQLLGGRTDTTVANSLLSDHVVPGPPEAPLTSTVRIPNMRRPVRVEAHVPRPTTLFSPHDLVA